MLKVYPGWAACPIELYQAQECLNSNWTTAAMTEKVLLTAYKQRATTSYNSQDFTILDSRLVGDPEIHPLPVSQYRAIWDKIFIPNAKSTSADRTLIESLTWSMGWLLRFYEDDFPDDNTTPLRHLQNFLAVPIQFAIACIIQANSTNFPGFTFPLPDDMITTAEGGVSTQRLVGQKWTLAVFIATAGTLLVIALVVLLWMITIKAGLPPVSDIPEVDIMIRAGDATHDERIKGMRDLVEDVRTRGLIEARWPHKMAFGIRRARLSWKDEHDIQRSAENGTRGSQSNEPEAAADDCRLTVSRDV
jgi:hypothetical protein